MIDRRRSVVHCAVAASCVWLIPLAGVTAAIAYFSLLFSDFVAEAFSSDVPASTYLLVLGLPLLAFVLASAAGLSTCWVSARWISRMSPLSRIYPWVLGTSAAVIGGLVGALVFYAVATATNLVSFS